MRREGPPKIDCVPIENGIGCILATTGPCEFQREAECHGAGVMNCCFINPKWGDPEAISWNPLHCYLCDAITKDGICFRLKEEEDK